MYKRIVLNDTKNKKEGERERGKKKVKIFMDSFIKTSF